MTNIALASRTYGEGRIVLLTDRLGSSVGFKGTNSDYFWRRLLEWNGKKSPGNKISIAVVVNENVNYRSKIRRLRPIEFSEIDLQFISRGLLSQFDICYFIGLNDEVNSNVKDELQEFVDNGGGLLIENPNIKGPIEILENIDPIEVTSIQRPNLTSGYWTTKGLNSYFYDETAKLRFLSTIKYSALNSNWSVLITDNFNDSFSDVDLQNINAETTVYSEFGVSNLNKFVDGIILLEEEVSSSSSESSSSSSSFPIILQSESSSSSSGTLEEFDWSLCDNLVAFWNLDDDEPNSIIREQSNIFALTGQIFGALNINSRDLLVSGKLDQAISLDQNYQIKTLNTDLLNFSGNNSDEDFSIAFWFYPRSNSPSVLFDKGGDWIVACQNGSCSLTTIDENGAERIRTSTSSLVLNKWNFVVLSYNASLGLDGIKTYVNGHDRSFASFGISSYTKRKKLSSYLVMGNNLNLNASADIILDNVSIFDKALDNFESEILYNGGIGTKECEGIYNLDNSSSSSSAELSFSSSSSSNNSSSSSSIDSSSSSSLDSSSSSSIDSSSSSSSNDSNSSSSSSEGCLIIASGFGYSNYNGTYKQVGNLNGFGRYRNDNNIEIGYWVARGIGRFYIYPTGIYPDIQQGVYYSDNNEVNLNVTNWTEWLDPSLVGILGQATTGSSIVGLTQDAGVTTPTGC